MKESQKDYELCKDATKNAKMWEIAKEITIGISCLHAMEDEEATLSIKSDTFEHEVQRRIGYMGVDWISQEMRNKQKNLLQDAMSHFAKEFNVGYYNFMKKNGLTVNEIK